MLYFTWLWEITCNVNFNVLAASKEKFHILDTRQLNYTIFIVILENNILLFYKNGINNK